jgi:predicted PurR-regulated permease PerM
MINRLQKIGLPRILGAFLVYFGAIALIIGVLSMVLPPLAGELAQLAVTLPDYLRQSSFFPEGTQTVTNILSGSQEALQQLSQQLGQISGGLLTATSRLVGGFVSLVVILVIAFYLSVQDEGIKRFLKATVPQAHQGYVLKLVARSQRTLAHWLEGGLLVGTAVGLMTFIGLTILGVKFALVLSILAFLFEFIPFLGPILAAIPAIIIAFFQDVNLGLLVVLLYLIVQQTENHILTPQVMKKAVGLNPIFVILALLIGAKLGGLAGLLLAVPLLAITVEFLEDMLGFQLKIPPR